MNYIAKMIEKMPDWILSTLIISIIIYSIIKIRLVIDFIIIGLFGKDKNPNYKEMTGALGFIGILIMITKHLLDPNYNPDLNLLLFCAGIVLTMAGLDKILDIFDRYLTNKIENTIPKMEKKKEKNEEKL